MTVAKIVEFKPKADPGVVAALKDLLADAEAGRLLSIMWIGDCGDVWSNGSAGPFDTMARMGALARLAHRAQLAADKTASD